MLVMAIVIVRATVMPYPESQSQHNQNHCGVDQCLINYKLVSIEHFELSEVLYLNMFKLKHF